MGASDKTMAYADDDGAMNVKAAANGHSKQFKRATTPTHSNGSAKGKAKAAEKPASQAQDDDPITIGIVVPLAIVAAISYLWYWSYHHRRGDQAYADSYWSVPTVVTLSYLGVVFVGPRLMKNRKAFKLKNYMLVYNVYQTGLNILMCYSFISTVLRLNMRWWGTPTDLSVRAYDLSFWIFVHYTNKYMELADTLFMILRKKSVQVSFLHVYHHALLIWAWFLVTKLCCGGDAYFGALANSFIHVVMYSYYAMRLLKIPVPWKRYITQLQLVQFVVCLAHALYVIYYNTYPRRLTCVQVWVMLNMLVLFMNFYDEQYNKKKVRWTIINGKRYDISKFVNEHPGGSDLIMLAVGRDASIMFGSYHRRLDVAMARLKEMPELEELPPRKLDGSRLGGKERKEDAHRPVTGEVPEKQMESELYSTIRKRVNKYFKDTKQSSRGGMVLKSLALVVMTWTTWYFVVYHSMWYLTPLLGAMLACNGLAIQHDANHGAFSKSPVVNRIFGFFDDLIGGSALMWRHQHVISHHAHPNDIELDADTFSNFPLIRTNPQLPRRFYMRFQHIYGPIMYCLLGISYTTGDVVEYFKGRYEHVRMQPLRFIDKFLFWFGKFMHLLLLVAIPIYARGWWGGLVMVYLPTLLCGGWVLATVFAVSHNSHVTEYNLPRDMDWAEQQIRTSCNWGPNSSFWLHFAGGLNFQIEHHLFPGVAHIHYPAISKIIKDECNKRNIPYGSFDKFRSLYASHVSTLRRLGNSDKFD